MCQLSGLRNNMLLVMEKVILLDSSVTRVTKLTATFIVAFSYLFGINFMLRNILITKDIEMRIT